MDGARGDVLAYMAFPREHWPQIASTNPLERLNGEMKRRADVVGIFPNDRAVVRLVGALMLEQNDEWAVGRRYMSLESLGALSDDPVLRLSAVAAGSPSNPAEDRRSYTTPRDTPLLARRASECDRANDRPSHARDWAVPASTAIERLQATSMGGRRSAPRLIRSDVPVRHSQ
jgi:hypothetical protein